MSASTSPRDQQYPKLPPEFFQVQELINALGPQRRAGLIELLKASNVSFVVGQHGWPLVYRDRLLPSGAHVDQDTSPAPAQPFDFTAIHAPSRTPAHRR